MQGGRILTQEIRLNVGCGRDLLPGWVNCDYVTGPGVDRVFDASKRFPFPDDSVDRILISHVLEHIFNWPDTILECHRVLKLGGEIEIRVPYGVGWHNADPHHVRFFWPGTMDHFIEGADSNVSALDPIAKKKMFDLKKLEVRRIFWYGWHLKKYLHVGSLYGRRYTFPIGKKAEIVWVLRKV